MCYHDLREKDRELLEPGRQDTYELPHGVSVTLNILRFKVDENRRRPELGRGIKKELPSRNYEDVPRFFDIGYFYCPYIPIMPKGE